VRGPGGSLPAPTSSIWSASIAGSCGSPSARYAVVPSSRRLHAALSRLSRWSVLAGVMDSDERRASAERQQPGLFLDNRSGCCCCRVVA
jgi:hypothetical protein